LIFIILFSLSSRSLPYVLSSFFFFLFIILFNRFVGLIHPPLIILLTMAPGIASSSSPVIKTCRFFSSNRIRFSLDLSFEFYCKYSFTPFDLKSFTRPLLVSWIFDIFTVHHKNESISINRALEKCVLSIVAKLKKSSYHE
jgi:hypothetical protein